MLRRTHVMLLLLLLLLVLMLEREDRGKVGKSIDQPIRQRERIQGHSQTTGEWEAGEKKEGEVSQDKARGEIGR